VSDLPTLGRYLVVAGLAIAVLGGLIMISGRVPLLRWFGQLPGDLVIRRGPLTIYAPIVTSILLSLVLSIALYLFTRR